MFDDLIHKNILLLDSSGALAASLQSLWGQEVVATTNSLGEFTTLLQAHSFDLLIVDLTQVEAVVIFSKVVQIQPSLGVLAIGGNRVEAEQAALAYSVNLLGQLPMPVQQDDVARYVRHTNSDMLLSESAFLSGLVSEALTPIFQPKWHIAAARVAGVEVLARWQGDDGSLLGADAIIEQARRGDYMDVFTHRMLDRALSEQARWRADGIDLPFAVNIAGENLNKPDFADLVRDLLAHYESPARALQLELSDADLDRFMGDTAIANLAKLKVMGVGLLLDDFGRNYAAIMDLEPLPFDEIIIDRRFVLAALERDNARLILRSALNLAADLGLATTCEGVETSDHLALVKNMGAQYAMGYHVGRPMAAPEFLSWYKDNYH